MRRVGTGALEHYEQAVRVRVARPGRSIRRVCAGTRVHYEQTARKEWESLVPTTTSAPDAAVEPLKGSTHVAAKATLDAPTAAMKLDPLAPATVS
jgi:hypothetical protein